jgi:hypothetical protein
MTHKALEQYFHLIVNKQQKETTMFEKTKMFFNEQIEKLNSLLTKPVAFKEEAFEDGYWGFEMYTPAWINEHGEKVEPVHTVLVEPHEGTWMEVLDTVLDAMEAHYGYNIKEQVYYSVNFPLNQSDLSGYGRCLNDERLQQILLAFPELYLSGGWGDNTQREAMFK